MRQWSYVYILLNLLTRNESRAGLKKDLTVSRNGPGESLNVFFFSLSIDELTIILSQNNSLRLNKKNMRGFLNIWIRRYIIIPLYIKLHCKKISVFTKKININVKTSTWDRTWKSIQSEEWVIEILTPCICTSLTY